MGRFFDRVSDGGFGRLEFAEWVKDLLVGHQNHQIIIFDPYFEDAGIGLIAPNPRPHGDYIVFTSLPKPEAHKASRRYTPLLRLWDKWRNRRKPPVTRKTRINNLLASCEQLAPLMWDWELRVYGLKYGTLHDRYFLIVDQDGIPTVGYHLSNSIQKENEDYPILITPIPSDVLLKVHTYASEILTQAFEAPSGTHAETSKAQLLFDSKVAPTASLKRIEPLNFLDKHLAGDVFAKWTGEHSLRRLEGDALRESMRNLGLLNGESLVLHGPGPKGCLDQQAGNFTNFNAKWEVLAEILANTYAGKMVRTVDFSAETAFLSFLAKFVSSSFDREHDGEVDAPLAHFTSSYFQESAEMLLASSCRPKDFYHPVKYVALSWSEFFAVQILWHHAPDALLSITEAEAATMSKYSRQSGAVKTSLLSQIVSEIALGAQIGVADVQRDRLIRSPNGLLKWMGLNYLESELRKPSNVRDVVQ